MPKISSILLALSLFAIISTLFFFSSKSSPNPSEEPQIPTPVYDLWTHWKTKHNKKYGSEDEHRLKIFYENYKKVINHHKIPTRTYEMGFTKFMDLTPKEFKDKFLTTKTFSIQNHTKFLPNTTTPTSIDWRQKGAVNAVKDQEQCGSCWAFSTTGSLEGLAFVSGMGTRSFSEQQLIDCSTAEGNQGCDGGWMDYGFEYVMKHGITDETKYPYLGFQQQNCTINTGDFKIQNYSDVPQNDVNQLTLALMKLPVSIAVDAENWQLYSSGVFSDCGENLDHGVLLVGYTPESWIVKNSWGEGWGEHGYIRLARGNTCGLAKAASYPSLE